MHITWVFHIIWSKIKSLIELNILSCSLGGRTGYWGKDNAKVSGRVHLDLDWRDNKVGGLLACVRGQSSLLQVWSPEPHMEIPWDLEPRQEKHPEQQVWTKNQKQTKKLLWMTEAWLSPSHGISGWRPSCRAQNLAHHKKGRGGEWKQIPWGAAQKDRVHDLHASGSSSQSNTVWFPGGIPAIALEAPGHQQNPLGGSHYFKVQAAPHPRAHTLNCPVLVAELCQELALDTQAQVETRGSLFETSVQSLQCIIGLNIVSLSSSGTDPNSAPSTFGCGPYFFLKKKKGSSRTNTAWQSVQCELLLSIVLGDKEYQYF